MVVGQSEMQIFDDFGSILSAIQHQMAIIDRLDPYSD